NTAVYSRYSLAKLYAFDAAHSKYKQSGPDQRKTCGRHEGQVEFSRAVYDPARQRRRQHARQVAEAILKSGPLPRGARPGQRLRNGPEIRSEDAIKKTGQNQKRHRRAV